MHNFFTNQNFLWLNMIGIDVSFITKRAGDWAISTRNEGITIRIEAKCEERETGIMKNISNKEKVSAVGNKRIGLMQEIRKKWFFYLIPLPGILCLILFSYLPMAGLYVVFERYTYQGGLFGSEFIGLQNFKFFFMNINNAIRATRNTLVINGWALW